ncbi:Cytosolic carboxypeptidase 2 [Rhizophlyctis rosea]|uniref:Cytosolic carboxypeptidase 2 n=1 Tax=Rhizophlyctis rosea TaxID=64517 RepID=A0AAD5SA88_9FUNG|nr:Cytosolic carboxypeptidase 2 [Rhizophlyctis rosea]
MEPRDKYKHFVDFKKVASSSVSSTTSSSSSARTSASKSIHPTQSSLTPISQYILSQTSLPISKPSPKSIVNRSSHVLSNLALPPKRLHTRSWTDPETRWGTSTGQKQPPGWTGLSAWAEKVKAPDTESFKEWTRAELLASREGGHHPEYGIKGGSIYDELGGSSRFDSASSIRTSEETLDESRDSYSSTESMSSYLERKISSATFGRHENAFLQPGSAHRSASSAIDDYETEVEYPYRDDAQTSTGFPTTIIRTRPAVSSAPKVLTPRPLPKAKNEIPVPRRPIDMNFLPHPPILSHLPPKRKPEPLTVVPSDIKRGAGLRPAPKRVMTGFEPVLVYEAKYDENPLKDHWQLESEDDRTLLFESRFESGNLKEAVRVGEYEYDLKVRQDTNTRGHTQWFYFRLANIIPQIPYYFNIINLMKPDSLYNYGMQPLMYSMHDAELNGIGWQRVGTDISYFRSSEESQYAQRALHTLRFCVVFEQPGDTVYFAHCYPYSYTDLQRYLYNLKQDSVKSLLFRHRVLCNSLGGNNLDLLSITTPVQTPADLSRRKAIVISARVHPGETNSSYMLKGLLDYLLKPSQTSTYLLNNFVIKLIPMLNPDGVIVGNHRTNLLGYDLNRQWGNIEEGGKEVAPEIWWTREMIARVGEGRGVELFCDLHGHNRRHGIFMYGCHNDGNLERRYKERVFPYLLSKHAPNIFFFKRCQFKIQRAKEGTARIQIWRQFNLLNSFTMEASFCGSDQGPDGGFHYSIEDLEEMGRRFGETLYTYFAPKEEEVAVPEVREGVKERVKEKAMEVSGVEPSQVIEEVWRELVGEIERGEEEVVPENEGEGEDDTSSDDEVMRIPVKKKKITKKRSESRSSVGASSGGRRDKGGKEVEKGGVVREKTKSVTKITSERKSAVELPAAIKKANVHFNLPTTETPRRFHARMHSAPTAPSPPSPSPVSKAAVPVTQIHLRIPANRRTGKKAKQKVETPEKPVTISAPAPRPPTPSRTSSSYWQLNGTLIPKPTHLSAVGKAAIEQNPQPKAQKDKETETVPPPSHTSERQDSAIDLVDFTGAIVHPAETTLLPNAKPDWAEPIVVSRCSLSAGRATGSLKERGGRSRIGRVSVSSLWHNPGGKRKEKKGGEGSGKARGVIQVPVALPKNE